VGEIDPALRVKALVVTNLHTLCDRLGHKRVFESEPQVRRRERGDRDRGQGGEKYRNIESDKERGRE
jgi:hypothetical protein